MERYKSMFIKESKLPQEEAYWINPRGQILPMSTVSRHINEIIKNPKAFGYTSEELQSIFDNEGESFEMEGNAREKIILNLIKKGWSRIRRYTRPERWTINVSNLSNKIKDILQYWASKMIEAGWSKYEDVYIDLPTGKNHFTMNDLANDILYMKEGVEKPKKRFVPTYIDSVMDFNIIENKNVMV